MTGGLHQFLAPKGVANVLPHGYGNYEDRWDFQRKIRYADRYLHDWICIPCHPHDSVRKPEDTWLFESACKYWACDRRANDKPWEYVNQCPVLGYCCHVCYWKDKKIWNTLSASQKKHTPYCDQRFERGPATEVAKIHRDHDFKIRQEAEKIQKGPDQGNYQMPDYMHWGMKEPRDMVITSDPNENWGMVGSPVTEDETLPTVVELPIPGKLEYIQEHLKSKRWPKTSGRHGKIITNDEAREVFARWDRLRAYFFKTHREGYAIYLDIVNPYLRWEHSLFPTWNELQKRVRMQNELVLAFGQHE